MDMSELDRMMAERESRLGKKEAEGIDTFADQLEKEKEQEKLAPVDTEIELKREGQSLVNRMRMIEQEVNEYMMTFQADPPPHMIEEAEKIEMRLEEINKELQKLHLSKQAKNNEASKQT